jgi:hypothetical protein
MRFGAAGKGLHKYWQTGNFTLSDISSGYSNRIDAHALSGITEKKESSRRNCQFYLSKNQEDPQEYHKTITCEKTISLSTA